MSALQVLVLLTVWGNSNGICRNIAFSRRAAALHDGTCSLDNEVTSATPLIRVQACCSQSSVASSDERSDDSPGLHLASLSAEAICSQRWVAEDDIQIQNYMPVHKTPLEQTSLMQLRQSQLLWK